jgi:protein TBF1
MDGLDRVKGPYWSQILALYGAGGSIGEVLKDRNQVQLKDKARNLKLFFLKSGIEVPVYLQKVTGELKTRAPAQAAKREMKERMRQMEEERRLALPGSGSAVGDKVASKATA